MLLWLTEPRPVVRWGGLVAIVALLAAFGQLHGSLLGHQRRLAGNRRVDAAELGWSLAPTLVVLRR